MSSDGTITRQQRRALIAAWLGWAFDGLDGYLYVLVAVPFVTRLMDRPVPDADVKFKAAIIQACFLVGWAIGGAVFGRIGDRLGRSRTLTLTILTYALFTGLSFFAQRWWHLLIFRFIAALGIGGEWAAGSALVSETLHARHRAWASAALQSGYMVGCIAASLTTGLLGDIDPRYVFLVGVAPALVTAWIRRAVPEPEEWRAAGADQPMPAIAELFRPGLRSTTLLTLGLTSVALTTVWAFLFFAVQLVDALPEVKTWDAGTVAALKSRVTIAYLIVNIFANFCATYFARAVGYRRAFFVYLAGAMATYLFLYRTPPTLASIYWVTCATAFFSLGVFGPLPLYIPRLFPTLLRTLGAGVTYNVGRVAAAVGTLFAGDLASRAGGPSGAIWWTGLLYIPGLIICFFLPLPAASESELV